ncbi:hypothetical protein Anas_10212 [Armadillidium nasatum]|uniref:Uncharacterized protein n=1 Tax=Armadillidium nasatum TaxID=96803 RepID=A0A5N5TJB8_9CRUS|nr:hypothetical protein Anas_10212 [Armadillidium nasatum]
MLRIESYVTPIILSYVDKYIKNLKPEDSKVSLWGGDAVFNNLDLKLDVLEEELKLPFSFLNGHIHELQCILKLKDYSQTEDESSTQSNKDSESGCHENQKRQKRIFYYFQKYLKF